MGFAIMWVDLIMRCIIPSFSVLVNDRKGNSFKPSRGLRQGDSFGAFLFLLCNERLLALLRMAMTDGNLRGIKASRSGLCFSHMLFIDDSILFESATAKDARVIKGVVLEYEMCVQEKRQISISP